MPILVRLLIIFVIAILLSSCTNQKYLPIQEDLSIAATVNIKDMTVSFIDIKNMKKLHDWDLKKPYTGAVILPDGDTLLLFGKQVETVDLFSLKGGKMISSWKTGKGIVNGKLLNTNSNIALADQNLGKIRFFNFDGEEIAQIKTASNPLTILESVKEKKLYVLSFSKEKLTVIDLNGTKKVSEYDIHPAAAGAWLNEGGNELWIGGHGAGAEVEKDIHVYNSDTGELTYKIPAPSMPVNFLEFNHQVFVLSHGSSMLYQLNVEGKVINSKTIGANPFEIAIFDQYLIIAGYDSNDIHIVNPATLEIIKTIPVGKGPFRIVLRERK
ncbi:WD40 repeat domain-containing protein [Bacillus sp. DTU_2020_1000418_1_SI_GHA_SEK_038]|uniref:YncE family protein n=1 Tax=Bacillus sp. DTU_2020_1000418_1_SI_GHA_SEK_038 TaxID=3077585 RepID=UPI0028E6FCB1|nr:WD40 repeat domain-containing protein [Bacillus sp. DTU_2020_1000418_1_SI_GHA_SEK_038]WNS73871.1 WD40 repeat domain-containing protein [Bacillus sp. DTU_2020_1000418_1_SI_GHA_SEK_038]